MTRPMKKITKDVQPLPHPEVYIYELDGFLNALQRLCGYEFGFSAQLIPRLDDPVTDLTIYFKHLEGIQKITYQQVQDLLNDYIYQHLCCNKQPLIHELDWQLIGYYGLAHTASNPQDTACFNPLVSFGAFLIKRPRIGEQLENLCFAVPIKGYYILTYLQRFKPF